jgi:excisionase family DNA binding protein
MRTVDRVPDNSLEALAALTIAGTAARFGVSPALVYRLVRRGELPGAARVGRSWRVDPRHLEGLFWRDAPASEAAFS